MGMNHFTKAWDHKLSIRDLLGSMELPAASETISIGRKVVERIQALQEGLQADDALLHDLDEVIERFQDLDEVTNDYEARDRFNEALSHLYDEADYGKRVWIE